MNKRAAIAISVFVLLVGVTIAVIVLTTKSNYTTLVHSPPIGGTGCGTNCGEDICNRDDGKYPCVVKCCKGEDSCTCDDVPPQNWTVPGYPTRQGCICNGYGPCDGGTCSNCDRYGDLGLDPTTSCTTCKGDTVWDENKCVSSTPVPLGPLTLCGGNGAKCISLYVKNDPGIPATDPYIIEVDTCYNLNDGGIQ